jgi:hypothetical protein
MEHARLRKPSVSHGKGTLSGDRAFLAAAAKCLPSMPIAARDEGRMTTAVDTNVVIALWDRDSTLSLAAQNALDAAFNRGTLVAAAPVFAELIASPGAAKNSSGPLLRKQESGLIGSSASKFGDRRGGFFKPMQSGAGSSAIRARAVSLRISSWARMHLQTDSAFSPSTRAHTGPPSQALLLRPSEILSPSSLETVSGFWRASIHAASLAPSVQVKKCARISQTRPVRLLYTCGKCLPFNSDSRQEKQHSRNEILGFTLNASLSRKLAAKA